MLFVSQNIGRIYSPKCQLYVQGGPKYQKIITRYLKNLYTSREKTIIPNHVHFSCIPQPPSLRMRKCTKFLFSWVQEQEYVKYPGFLVINLNIVYISYFWLWERPWVQLFVIVFFFSVVPKENINIETQKPISICFSACLVSERLSF